MAEFEFGGMTFRGGKMMVLLTALSTLGGASWAAFEFYKDYMDMKEVVLNIDVGEIEARNAVIETKLDEAIDYTRDIKGGLREDLIGLENEVDRVDDKLDDTEAEVRALIDAAEERFDNKRDRLQSDYDERATRLRESNDDRIREVEAKVERQINDLEARLEEKIQKSLDNPLSGG